MYVFSLFFISRFLLFYYYLFIHSPFQGDSKIRQVPHVYEALHTAAETFRKKALVFNIFPLGFHGTIFVHNQLQPDEYMVAQLESTGYVFLAPSTSCIERHGSPRGGASQYVLRLPEI
jgi:hypothetical protein